MYMRNVGIKGRMTKEKYQLIKMTNKLVEEINLMFVEVEQEQESIVNYEFWYC